MILLGGEAYVTFKLNLGDTAADCCVIGEQQQDAPWITVRK
jgi:hypothetical protein